MATILSAIKVITETIMIAILMKPQMKLLFKLVIMAAIKNTIMLNY
jgi:hypothetical protein